MPKVCSEPELIIHAKEKGKKISECFNSNTTLSDKTKLIIVGTITPPNTSYFYCSPRNRIYGLIDESLERFVKEEKLKDLKKDLISSSENKEKIISKKIISILKKHNIAFLDVMEKVIRKDETSCQDSDIDYYTLAEKQFKKIPASATVITNSNLADKCFNKIVSKNCICYKKKLKLSQRIGGRSTWVDAISEAIDKC